MALRTLKKRTTPRPVVPPPVQQAGEPLAESIRKISASVKSLLNTGLNKKAILVLLQSQTKLGVRTIAKVLDGLEKLESEYTTRKGKP